MNLRVLFVEQRLVGDGNLFAVLGQEANFA